MTFDLFSASKSGCSFNTLALVLVLDAPQIENLQEQLRDKDKQLGNLKDRVKSLQTDSSNTDTALATLEEALSEKVGRFCDSDKIASISVVARYLRFSCLFFFNSLR